MNRPDITLNIVLIIIFVLFLTEDIYQKQRIQKLEEHLVTSGEAVARATLTVEDLLSEIDLLKTQLDNQECKQQGVDNSL
jgi:hypothetical protein